MQESRTEREGSPSVTARGKQWINHIIGTSCCAPQPQAASLVSRCVRVIRAGATLLHREARLSILFPAKGEATDKEISHLAVVWIKSHPLSAAILKYYKYCRFISNTAAASDLNHVCVIWYDVLLFAHAKGEADQFASSWITIAGIALKRNYGPWVVWIARSIRCDYLK